MGGVCLFCTGHLCRCVAVALTHTGPPCSLAFRCRNWAAGVPLERCSAGTEGHNTASIGGFVMLPPVILGALRQGVEAAQGAAVRHLALTHESAGLAEYAKVCVHVCACVVMGAAAAGGGCAMVRSCSADGDGCVLSLCRPHSPCAAAAAAAAALWLLLPSCD